MKPTAPDDARGLIKAVAILQLKLLLDAARDLALSPLALAAALVDLILIKRQPPRLFRAVLRIGEFSDRWIDVWSGGDDEAPPRENVDALLARIEEVVRDPQTGARRARVLKRWAERQVTRARKRAAMQMALQSAARQDPAPRPPDGPDPSGRGGHGD